MRSVRFDTPAAMRLLLALALLLLPGVAMAQDDAPDPVRALAATADDYRDLARMFDRRTGSTELRPLLDRAHGIAQDATGETQTLTTQMALVDARIAQLGPVQPGVTEAPDIRAQRRTLAQERGQFDSAIKRGKLLAIEADQLAAQIDDTQANAFNARISARTASPLTMRFWHSFAAGLPRDAARVGTFTGHGRRAIAESFRGGHAWPAIFGLIAAIVLLFPARIAAMRFGRTFMIARAPGSRLRRTGLALWLAVAGTATPGLAAVAFVTGLDAAGMIPDDWQQFALSFERVAFIAAAFVALGGALLQPQLASWRLPTISDHAAAVFMHWTRITCIVVIATALPSAFMSEAGSGAPLTIATDGFSIVLQIGVALGVLRTVGRLRAKAEADAAEDPERLANLSGGALVGGIALVGWGAALFAILALLSGYFMLALTISRTMLWWPLLASGLYLLLLSADDLITGFVQRDSGLGQTLIHGFGLRASIVDQAGVFLSALVRLLLIALAFTMASGPFGSNFSSLLDIAVRASRGFTFGQITISPGAIVRAFAVLGLGLFVVRVIQHWLTDRYLPATDFDAGARNSIAMVARYTGLILAVLWALASLGIGLERIALLLSALSVGIGFGLQAITQNFVSGLILLAERPVKIGDWVRIGTDEGDIKRISVRATEIQIADKSTLIVPNSELITKAVLNKTMADPLGRIQLQFSLPLGADVVQARDMLLTMYRETTAVLDEPAPVVFVDGIADGRIGLNSFAYVRSPRDVYSTRSAILFRLLEDLPAAGIELGSSPTQMQIISGGTGSIAPPPDESPAADAHGSDVKS